MWNYWTLCWWYSSFSICPFSCFPQLKWWSTRWMCHSRFCFCFYTTDDCLRYCWYLQGSKDVSTFGTANSVSARISLTFVFHICIVLVLLVSLLDFLFKSRGSFESFYMTKHSIIAWKLDLFWTIVEIRMNTVKLSCWDLIGILCDREEWTTRLWINSISQLIQNSKLP
jgi:hypothetical protein